MKTFSRIKTSQRLMCVAFAVCMFIGTTLMATEVVSPDGKLRIVVKEKDGALYYSVTHKKGVIIEDSRMGITINDKDLGSKAVIGKDTPYKVDETYATRGNKTVAVNRCNGKKVKLSSGGTDWELDLRAYNGGVAFRYVVPAGGKSRVNGESTSWAMPKGVTAWYQTDTRMYEGRFWSSPADNIPLQSPQQYRNKFKDVKTTICAPITLVYPNGLYAALTEAEVMENSGMTFAVDGSNTLKSLFEDDPKGWNLGKSGKSAWRVVTVAENLTELVNNDVIANVCAAPDPKLFPKGAKTDWIKPGRALWQWWGYNGPGTHWSNQKWFVDQAAKLGCEYYLVDDGWEKLEQEWFKEGGNGWPRMKELCDYAAERKVGILVWRANAGNKRGQHPGLETEEKREEFFRKCAEVGVKGVKIDFMNSESSRMLQFYEDCLRKGAKYKVMVNFHGANKPAGESRTWPNEITREAIQGLEWTKWSSMPADHYTKLPFTRLLAGHADFTPTTFQKRFMNDTTAALQLASAVFYTSPLLCWADKPDVYLQSSALEHIRAMPAVWDETRVLKGSTIGGVAGFVRRAGSEWYVAIINGTETEQSYDLNLSFLGAGSYIGNMVEDNMSDPLEMKHSSGDYAKNSKVNVKMLPGGGFLLRLSKVTMTPCGGAFTGKNEITVASAEKDDDLRYTVDGSEPNKTSSKVAGPISIGNTCVLKVKAINRKGVETTRQFVKLPEKQLEYISSKSSKKKK